MVKIKMTMDALGNIDVPSRAIVMVVNQTLAVAAVAEQETHLIGLQGTSMCNQGSHVLRIPYKSGHFFTTFCKKIPSIY
jgi:hypothetical protein